MARIIFLGTPEFAVPILEALLGQHQVVAVVTQPDRPAGRGRTHVAASPVKRVAEAHGVPVWQPENLRRDRAVVEAMRRAAPELMVLAAFGQILRPDVLSIPPHGCIGVHASLLPRWRGPAPIAAAILHGDAETGISLMLTDAGMDTGPILAQERLAIATNETTVTLTARLAHLGADLLLRTIPPWLAGEIAPQPQDETRATYAPPLTKEDGLLNWREPALQLDRRIRALTPWPGTYTFHQDVLLRVLHARPIPAWAGTEAPGTVVETEEGIGVVTGSGLLLLEEVQLAGKKALDARAFARGQRAFVGSVLG